MKYLPICLFETKNRTIHFPLVERDREGFYETLLQLLSNLSEKERDHYFLVYSNPKAVVFDSWIAENKSLSQTLNSQSFDKPFQDSNNVFKHAFLDEFQQFLSPFLLPICEKEVRHTSLNALHLVVGYSALLPEYEQNLVQDAVAEFVHEQVGDLEDKLHNSRSDRELHQHAASFLTDNFVIALNGLNSRHYFVKRKVLDTFLKLIEHKNTSARLMLYISERLHLFELTPEHTRQLEQLNKNVKSGKIVLEKTRVSWGRFGLIFGVVIVVAIGLVALFSIDGKPKEISDQEKTAYMSFSKEERQRLDSLINNLKKEDLENYPVALDSDMPFIGEDLVQKKNWNNRQFQRIYDRWRTNDTVAFTTFFSTAQKTNQAYVHTKKLQLKEGKKTMELHNTSQQMVLVIVFKNEENEPLFTQYVSAKSVQTWKVDEGDFLIVVPGNKVPSHAQFGELPFKELNAQFFHHLGMSYQVGHTSSKHIKLIWETSGSESYLVDLSLALEKG